MLRDASSVGNGRLTTLLSMRSELWRGNERPTRSALRRPRAHLNDGEAAGELARAQQHREVERLLDREAAGDLPAAAEDRLADHRRRDYRAVDHDGERVADVLLRDARELAGAGGVELEVDDRLLRARIEADLGVGQIAGGDHSVFIDQIGHRITVQHLGIRRRPEADRVLWGHALIDEPEFELAAPGRDLHQPLDVRARRQAEPDAVGIERLDRSARGEPTEVVEAALDHLDRVGDGLAQLDAVGRDLDHEVWPA